MQEQWIFALLINLIYNFGKKMVQVATGKGCFSLFSNI